MLFNSWEYALFLPLVVLINFSLPYKIRWAWLLMMSCFFYGYFIPEYLAVLFITIIVDYFAALLIAGSRGHKKAAYLWFSIGITCFILFIFKYYDFFTKMAGASTTLGLILPIGLSFHTFQSLSYVIEVYRGEQKPERHFGIYALYVMFFPQLVAGPIERPQNLLPQFRKKINMDPARLGSGLRLIIWGLFQKTVVADRLGVIVDHVFDHPDRSLPEARVIAACLFAFQIFADFQGYSNMARGSARLLGIELMKNFDRPYSSRSVTEFWRRWHISLSTWFRDYLFIPLGGSRCGALRTVINLLITFAVSGLWHGANWTFVIWGLLNGTFVAIERVWQFNSRVITFGLITLTWVFFRADSIDSALNFIASFPLGVSNLFLSIIDLQFLSAEFFLNLGTTRFDVVIVLLATAAMELIQTLERGSDLGQRGQQYPFVVRWISYTAFVITILFSWLYFPASTKPFIYFQF